MLQVRRGIVRALLLGVTTLAIGPASAPAAPGTLAGTITSAATGGGLVGGVHLYPAAGGPVVAQAFSGVDGMYTLSNLSPGSYKVELYANTQNNCNYAFQFYDHQTSAAAGASVTVSSGATLRIDAALASANCQQMLSVSLAGTGAGTVTGINGLSCPSTCSSQEVSGSVDELTAHPAVGSVFAGWSGACSGKGLCELAFSGATAFSGNQSATATFSPAPTDVTITSGLPVPEPASGSRPATFTISLPAASSSPTTITYKTVDGTAKAASSDYTAVPNSSDSGSVTIPANVTSAQVQVQINAGSGQSTTETKGFQVQLLSSSGAPISVTGGVAPGIITVPGIGGKLTDTGGVAQGNDAVTLEGTAGTGQTVSQHVKSDGSGRYRFFVDPGTYTVAPVAPVAGAGKPTFDAVVCPGTVQPGKCSDIALSPSAVLTANFKLISLIVNSTETIVNTARSAAGVCDVTPDEAQSTCTLSQAIMVSNQLGGRVIGFNIPGGGVPVIVAAPGHSIPDIVAPTTIDGTTQPGGRVELSGAPGPTTPVGLSVQSGGDGSLIRGMVIHGFGTQIQLGGSGGVSGVSIQGNFVGRDAAGHPTPRPQAEGLLGVLIANGSHNTIGGGAPGQGNYVSVVGFGGIVDGALGSAVRHGFNVIQGNQVSTSPPSRQSVPRYAIDLTGDHDTLGGRTASEGNTISGVVRLGEDTVVQGNTFSNSDVTAQNRDTIGGASVIPGQPPGNSFIASSLHLKTRDVVQGNHLRGRGVDVLGDLNTIGGSSPDLGNLLEHVDIAGVFIGHHGASNGNVIENNQVDGNGFAGVAVLTGVGNTIVANRMRANRLGIELGGHGEFVFNGEKRQGSGPNEYQPYPLLFTAASHGHGIVLSGKLIADPHKTYRIELYSQKSCAVDSVTPGQGEHYLGRHGGVHIDRLTGDAVFKLSLSRAAGGVDDHAVTATATSPDGSTSEFSPCLTLGHTAPSFVGQGVGVDDGTINVQNEAPSSFTPDRASSAAKKRLGGPTATLHPFCPPVTYRSCTGTIRLRTIATRGRPSIVVAQIRFKLAPGQLATIKFRVPRTVLTLLHVAHRVKLRATVTAHDGARHTKHTTRKLVLQ